MNVTLHIDGKPVPLADVMRKKDEVSFALGDTTYLFRGQRMADGSYVLEQRIAEGVWRRMSGAIWQGRNLHHVQLGALEAKISEIASASSTAAAQAELSPRAPMPGVVRRVLVKAGDTVTQGQALAVMEAMKLQVTLSAGADATVDAVLVREGERITEGAELVRLIARNPV